MKLREGKISILSLLIVSIITVLLMILELNSKSIVKAEYFNEKMAAAELTLQSFKAIKEAADTFNISIDRISDPNETGLIGLHNSTITTEKGDLNAKLTSTNPNFASLIVKFLKEAKVKKNDVVAISFSGSFPALNIAVLSAIKILNLKPVIITSVGSTMWGANYPQFTYLDMERVLIQEGLFEFKTIAASVGGKDDIGKGLSREGRESIEAAIARNNVHMLESTHLESAVQKRIEIYNGSGDVKLFINVDQGETALAGIDVGSGFIKAGDIKATKGIIARFSQLGIPTINLIDVNYLAEKYRLSIPLTSLPDIGKGNLYYEFTYSVKQALLSLVILFIIIFLLLKLDINYYFKKIKG